MNWKQKATASRLKTARKNRLCRLVAKTNASAISNHLNPKMNPRYFTHVQSGRVIDCITPVKKLRHLGSSAPGGQKDHLWQCDQSCCNG